MSTKWRKVSGWRVEVTSGINEHREVSGFRCDLVIDREDRRVWCESFSASWVALGVDGEPCDHVGIPRRGRLEDALAIAARHIEERGSIDKEVLSEEVHSGVCRYVDTVWINDWMPATGLDPWEIMRRLRRDYDDLDEAIADELDGLRRWGTSPDSEVPHDVPVGVPYPVTIDLDDMEEKLREIADERGWPEAA